VGLGITLKTSVFLQVRLDSSRLPRKALLKLADRTVIEHAMRALEGVDVDNRMLLTSEDSQADLAPLAEKAGWGIFAGPKDDVLARFILAARNTGTGTIIRATGDNPLVSPSMANQALKVFRETRADYTGFTGMPAGSGVEVIRTSSLETAFDEADDPYEREHVAPFLYRRPGRFRIEKPQVPPEYFAPDTRITLDTRDDFVFLETLFNDLYSGDVLDLDTLVPYLRSAERAGGFSDKVTHAG
jgi:spore coat polysaccharide biosynthesis protein SpsF